MVVHLRVRLRKPESAGIVRWGDYEIANGTIGTVEPEAYRGERHDSLRVHFPGMPYTIVVPLGWCELLDASTPTEALPQTIEALFRSYPEALGPVWCTKLTVELTAALNRRALEMAGG